MGFGTVIVVLAAILALVVIVRTRHGSRTGSDYADTFGDAEAAAREAELRREIEQLRERVQVLERIATEDRKRLGLAEEIERLRDN